MKASELRQLKWQLTATAALFGGCVVLAIVIIANRWFFESFLVEKYPTERSQLAGVAREVWEAAEQGDLDVGGMEALSPEQRAQLYDVWMNLPESQSRAAAALCKADSATFLDRAERTLVCGSHEQRRRAIEFLAMSQQPEVRTRLEFALDWARRRRLEPLAAELEAALAGLTQSR